MAGIKEMILNFQRIVANLPELRQDLALQMAHDAHALTADRIQNTGVNARGEKMRLYSENKLNLGLLSGIELGSVSKLEAFKKDAAKGKNNGSYSALRKAFGLPVDKRTLTFTSAMFKSIVQEVTEHTEAITIVTIRSDSVENQKKVNYNSKQVASNILAFSDEEKRLIETMNKKRIANLLNAK